MVTEFLWRAYHFLNSLLQRSIFLHGCRHVLGMSGRPHDSFGREEVREVRKRRSRVRKNCQIKKLYCCAYACDIICDLSMSLWKKSLFPSPIWSSWMLIAFSLILHQKNEKKYLIYTLPTIKNIYIYQYNKSITIANVFFTCAQMKSWRDIAKATLIILAPGRDSQNFLKMSSLLEAIT